MAPEGGGLAGRYGASRKQDPPSVGEGVWRLPGVSKAIGQVK